ncbi:dephospho-CoA kinase [Desulforamulus ruminis]|uniref:Dephospho-CoA kinase n=1 Tax=Desulforamulus ruminis (strain ATCC 23193 / DSM 2154 / NCIMB 8452 / DL) TaxID=696281 RepID=F6DP14_DESRL|nr:dephospho-CoA kinase [Desulforamulus ruminis]AEG60733.1 dephospho-CoA kinase [Desulforamulus ruminis DSM 2154]
MIIGLTGSIASGKSMVAKYLKELGARVIDADRVARQVVMPNTPALKEIVDSFGPGILTAEGTLDRQKLASIVFADPIARERLEKITHPRIEEEVNRQIEAFFSKNPRGILVLEVPLLIESGWHRKVDQIWLVMADEEIQLKRLAERDKLTPEQSRRRVASQMPQVDKAKYAQVIIHNSGIPEIAYAQVKEAWANAKKQLNHDKPFSGI